MKSSFERERERERELTWVTSAEVTHKSTTEMIRTTPPLYLQLIFLRTRR